MKEIKNYRVHFLVQIRDTRESGCSYRRTAQIHGVSFNTVRHACHWCESVHAKALGFLSRQSLTDIRSYRRMLLRDIMESLSLQESCTRHGCPAQTYRMWEYAYHSGLMEARERELSGVHPSRTEDMEKKDLRLQRTLSACELEAALKAVQAENEYLRCENAYLKKKMELEGRPVTVPDFRRGGKR